jgi:Methyltransferase FkbM domain
MKNFVKYAWSKRNKLWSKRAEVAKSAGRQAIRLQYRVAGCFADLLEQPTLAGAAGSVATHVGTHTLKKAANPFIEYENGRLRLKPAPISSTIRETYAQCNEDLIVEALLLAKMTLARRSMSTVRYLEIGGNHPVQTSSTYLLYRAWGARGCIVEANAGLAQRLRATRPRDTIIQTAVSDKYDATVSFYVHELDELSTLAVENIRGAEATGLVGDLSRVETVPNMHINAFFDTHINAPLDFMSIDIEGLDLPVLQALDPSHRPTVLQVECVELALVTKLRDALEPRGYELAAMTDVNVIFVQR